jgi:hypothetical protein
MASALCTCTWALGFFGAPLGHAHLKPIAHATSLDLLCLVLEKKEKGGKNSVRQRDEGSRQSAVSRQLGELPHLAHREREVHISISQSHTSREE